MYAQKCFSKPSGPPRYSQDPKLKQTKQTTDETWFQREEAMEKIKQPRKRNEYGQLKREEKGTTNKRPASKSRLQRSITQHASKKSRLQSAQD